MRVLVVDDDRLVCQSLKTILEATGEVKVVGMGFDGSDAVSLFAELEPDVLLMDIRMDGMTGLEACRQILSEFPQAKVLFPHHLPGRDPPPPIPGAASSSRRASRWAPPHPPITSFVSTNLRQFHACVGPGAIRSTRMRFCWFDTPPTTLDPIPNLTALASTESLAAVIMRPSWHGIALGLPDRLPPATTLIRVGRFRHRFSIVSVSWQRPLTNEQLAAAPIRSPPRHPSNPPVAPSDRKNLLTRRAALSIVCIDAIHSDVTDGRDPPMELSISPNNPVPLYQQIVDQLRAKILTGELRAGDPSPP